MRRPKSCPITRRATNGSGDIGQAPTRLTYVDAVLDRSENTVYRSADRILQRECSGSGRILRREYLAGSGSACTLRLDIIGSPKSARRNFQRCTVPPRTVRHCPVACFEEFQQRRLGIARLAYTGIGKHPFAQFGVPKSSLRPDLGADRPAGSCAPSSESRLPAASRLSRPPCSCAAAPDLGSSSFFL